MENYNSQSPYPNGNNNSYGHTQSYPPPNQPYPPPPNQPHLPPPNQPYPPPPSSGAYTPPYTYPPLYPQYPHPYTSSHSGHLNYPPSAPSTSGYHQSGPVEYGYAPPPSQPYPHHGYMPQLPPPTSSPQPTLQHHGSFGYDSSHHYPRSIPPRPLDSHPSRINISSLSSISSVTHFDQPVNPSGYPPVEDLLANMQMSETRPLGPNPHPMYHSGPIYGHPNSSFSGCEASSIQDESTPHHCPSHSDSFLEMSSNNQSLQIVPVTPSKGSLKVFLLHGNLDIFVHEAKNLPNMDMFHKTIGDVFNKLPGNVNTKIEGHMSQKITSDPYVTISVAGATIGRTSVISNSESPVWKQHFNVPVAHHTSEVHFIVKDSDVVGSQLIGTVAIPVEHIYGGGKVEGSFPILTSNGKPCKAGAVLSLSIQYTPMERLNIYHCGVGVGPEYNGVPGTYFPLRKGGNVTLYQDAHVPDGFLPNLGLDFGRQYVHGKCWRDIFSAIRSARRLVYITGWSVWHKVRLARDDRSMEGYTLGELLKSKSQEGVRVLLLVWDDPTSRSILGYKTDGVMATHDEETRRYFKHSSVQVLLCPRAAGKRHSWLKQREVGVIYTHHQKTVIVDAEAGNNKRRIVAFVGGLDLCDGRYDSPEHPIYRSLQTLHSDDYHNPTFVGSVAGCPREPWHDLHCKIDGPAAYDILTNFEERWLKASKPHGIKKLKISYDDALLRIERMPEILGIFDIPCVSGDSPEGWHVQIFRSIDSNSVKGFRKDSKEATMKNLMRGKNVLIDMSIHTAYVKAIRSAQHFIYIENQYFIGSSYNWSQYNNLGADNLIPMEIALKIADKIRAHERFSVYIVIPMWPEGNPTGAATQRILFWQNKTMQMMFETIYKALVEVGLEDSFSPQDYLNFFCLGNREALDAGDVPTTTDNPAAANSPQALSRKHRRFMIYVHSKGMIVDDEYVILGSANINQRSLEGTRDTEIAMGAYQPHHTWARKHSNPHGQIYGYRMSLWAEHLGVVEDCFTQPESLECVRRVRSMGDANWKQYAADEISEMRAHLLKYPVEVDRKGRVKPLPGCENFPDVGGSIVGSFLAIQENLTI
ncbi:unnamed protein product [Cuscuta europaea]|uniref:Phospholipase D alpha 1 n=1 Tax=Cuscuta europaea TaxID=41803 RepID=A0A9P0ZEV6_CUSEU|nr:unnamed protein product [Cuscuta europaea]